MDIKDLTIGQVEKIQTMFSNKTDSDNHPYEIGKNYLIRTVTMIVTGKLEFVGDQELKLSTAAWIADTGRFADALKDIKVFNEVEPFLNDVIVGRGAIVDGTIIDKLPTIQK